MRQRNRAISNEQQIMMISLSPPGIILLAILSCVLLAPSGAGAQESDVRLSGDYMQPVLPPDAQIQAADSIGDLTLVVWGSTVPQTGGTSRNVLLMQIVRGNLPLGTPEILTSPEAWPSGFVQVLAAGNQFVVLWNDRREGPLQAYLRRVGGDGALSAEQMLDGDAIAPQGAAWGARAGGYDLLWNSSNGSIRGRRTDADGAFLEAARTIAAGSFARALSPAELPGTTLLDLGPAGWLVLSGNDSPRSFTSPLPYHVGGDGGLLAIDGDRLNAFGSIADPQPLRSARFTVPDTALAGSLLVGRDPAGRPLVSYTVLRQRNIGTEYIFLYLQPYAMVETAPGVFSAPEPAGAGAEVLFTTSCHTVSVAADSVQIERSCRNRYPVSFHLRISTTAPDGCSPPSGTWQETISLVFADSLLFSPSQRYPYGNYDPCAPIPPVTVLRLASDSASMVAFARDSAAIRLPGPAAMQNRNLPEADPVLAQEGNTVLVGWRTTGNTPSATAGIWNPAGGGMSQPERLTLGDINDRSIRTLGNSLRLATEDRSALGGSGGGGAILEAKTHLRGEFPEYAAEWDDNSYYRLGGSGWQEVDINRRHDAGNTSSMLSVKYNPDEKTTLLALQRTSTGTGYSWTQLILWDSLGGEIWRGDSVPWVEGLTPQYMPLRDSQSIVAYLGGMQHINGTELGEKGTGTGLRQGGYAPFIKLYGEFLAQPYEIFLRGIMLEIIGTDFTIQAKSPPLPTLQTLPDPPFDMLALLQHPLDSGLIFLYGDSAGIHMDLFNRELVQQRSGVTVSATTGFAGELSALMHGDSLFVVWSDTRNGIADIYGRAIGLNGTSGVAAPGSSGTAPHALRVAAAPNPAAGSVLFSWEATAAGPEATILITDMLGARVAQFTAPAGAGEVRWDCSLLPPGVYHVAVTSGNRRGICKLVRQ